MASAAAPKKMGAVLKLCLPISPGAPQSGFVNERRGLPRVTQHVTVMSFEILDGGESGTVMKDDTPSKTEVAAKLKESNTKEMKFEEVVKSAEQAAALVLVY